MQVLTQLLVFLQSLLLADLEALGLGGGEIVVVVSHGVGSREGGARKDKLGNGGGQ